MITTHNSRRLGRAGLVALAATSFGLGVAACSDDDGNVDDLDNPLDGVDDQIDHQIEDMTSTIDTEVPDSD